MAVTVKLDVKKLEQLQRDIDPRARAIVKKTAFEVAKRSQANVRQDDIIDTGALVNSHAVRMRGADDSVMANAQARRLNPKAQDSRPPMPKDDLTAHVGPTVHYAIYQEMGTRKGIKPHRFLEKAVEAMRPSWEAAWKALFK